MENVYLGMFLLSKVVIVYVYTLLIINLVVMYRQDPTTRFRFSILQMLETVMIALYALYSLFIMPYYDVASTIVSTVFAIFAVLNTTRLIFINNKTILLKLKRVEITNVTKALYDGKAIDLIINDKQYKVYSPLYNKHQIQYAIINPLLGAKNKKK